MRTLLAVACILATLTPGVDARGDGPALALYQGEVTLLSWSPVFAADRYHVYRGVSMDTLSYLGSTDAPVYLDDNPSNVATIYLVTWESVDDAGTVWSTNTGHSYCVRVYDGLRFSVNAKNCVNR